MLTEREELIAAAMVRRRRGAWAPAWICGRIAALEKAGDTAGADQWQAILGRLAELEAGHVGTLQ